MSKNKAYRVNEENLLHYRFEEKLLLVDATILGTAASLFYRDF